MIVCQQCNKEIRDCECESFCGHCETLYKRRQASDHRCIEGRVFELEQDFKNFKRLKNLR